jgi:hypothetical protein
VRSEDAASHAALLSSPGAPPRVLASPYSAQGDEDPASVLLEMDNFAAFAQSRAVSLRQSHQQPSKESKGGSWQAAAFSPAPAAATPRPSIGLNLAGTKLSSLSLYDVNAEQEDIIPGVASSLSRTVSAPSAEEQSSFSNPLLAAEAGRSADPVGREAVFGSSFGSAARTAFTQQYTQRGRATRNPLGAAPTGPAEGRGGFNVDNPLLRQAEQQQQQQQLLLQSAQQAREMPQREVREAERLAEGPRFSMDNPMRRVVQPQAPLRSPPAWLAGRGQRAFPSWPPAPQGKQGGF